MIIKTLKMCARKRN
ncbi:hypothetical protein [Escherichia coli]